MYLLYTMTIINPQSMHNIKLNMNSPCLFRLIIIILFKVNVFTILYDEGYLRQPKKYVVYIKLHNVLIWFLFQV